MPDYDRTIYITFDVDWAADQVLAHALDYIEEAGLRATIFITHDSPVLDRLKNNASIEMGVHPNYRPLLSGEGRGGQARDELRRVLSIAPGAVSVRTHGLVASTDLSVLHAAHGLRQDASLFVPRSAGLNLKPFKHFSGLTLVPFFWEDDLHCLQLEREPDLGWEAGAFLDGPGLKIFNFHPIHYFLNTENLARYHAARPVLNDFQALSARVNRDGRAGAAVFLRQLVQSARRREIGFGLIRDLAQDRP